MSASHPVSVAVVICTVDRPAALRKCLDSLARQTRPAEEIVVVRGGASDAAGEHPEARRDLPVVTRGCVERNISASRNLGLASCRSSLVLFLDDDAEAEPDWIEELARCFTDHPEAWAVGGDVLDSRAEGRELEFSHGIVSSLGLQKPVLAATPRRVGNYRFINVKGCNFGVHRERVLSIGGFDEFFAFAFDEADLMARISRAGGRVVHAPSAVVHHTHVPGIFREADFLDRNWKVEFRSHLFFSLEHSDLLHRMLGRGVVWLRALKLAFRAKGRRVAILRAVGAGIRDAEREHRRRRALRRGGSSD